MTAVAEGAAATGAGAVTAGAGSAAFFATFLGAAATGAATGATAGAAASTATFLETVFVVFVAAGVAELIITDAVEVFMAGIRSTGAAGDSILGQGV